MNWHTISNGRQDFFIDYIIISAPIYRELNCGKLHRIVYEGGRTTGIVALELASGLLFSNLMATEGIPEIMTSSISGVSDSPYHDHSRSSDEPGICRPDVWNMILFSIR